METDRMLIQYIGIVMIFFSGFFRISTAASENTNPNTAESSFRYLVPEEGDDSVPNIYTRKITDLVQFEERLNQYRTVIAYFYNLKPPQINAIKCLQNEVGLRNGSVYFFEIELASTTGAIFEHYKVKLDAKKHDTILVFKNGNLIKEDSYIRGVTEPNKLKRIVYKLIYSDYIQSEAEYYRLIREMPKVTFIFDDGENEDKVRNLRDEIFDNEGDTTFVGIVTPFRIKGGSRALSQEYGVSEFPTVLKFTDHQLTETIDCTESTSSCSCLYPLVA